MWQNSKTQNLTKHNNSNKIKLKKYEKKEKNCNKPYKIKLCENSLKKTHKLKLWDKNLKKIKLLQNSKPKW